MLQKIWITPNKFIGERQDETSALQGTEAALFCLVTFLLTRQKHLHKAALHRLRHTEQPQLLVLSVPLIWAVRKIGIVPSGEQLECFHRETSQEETDNAASGIKAHALQFLHLLLVQRKEKKISKPEALRNQCKTKHFFSLQLCEIQTIIL